MAADTLEMLFREFCLPTMAARWPLICVMPATPEMWTVSPTRKEWVAPKLMTA